MSSLILFKLLAIFVVVAIGWVVGTLKWLGPATATSDPARTLSNAAYFIFVPALLFRTTARIDFSRMPWGTLVAVFVPLVVMLLTVYVVQRVIGRRRAADKRHNPHHPHNSLNSLNSRNDRADMPVAAPAVRALTAVFGNTAQVGIPMATALYGEAGLAIHLAIVSLHALVLLTLSTALVELDLARARVRQGHTGNHLGATLLATVRHTVIHPVVLPVLIGLSWNLLGWPLPAVVDEILLTLGQAVVPLCLVLIGMALAYYGVQGAARNAIALSVLKLLVLPALVLAIAHWGFHLSGMPLAVIVMMAALPIGSNTLVFAQRYRTLESETTAATVYSTLAFVVTAPLWLMLLDALA